jgi:hypothetical protein
MQSTVNAARQQTPPPYPRLQQAQQQQQQQQLSQGINVQQQLHHNQLKNLNVNTGATSDFRYGQSQNILSRNYQGAAVTAVAAATAASSSSTTAIGVEVNGTTGGASWAAQNISIPQGAQVNTTQRTSMAATATAATTTTASTGQPATGAFSQSNSNLPLVKANF